MNKEVYYTVCSFEGGKRVFVTLDEGGYPYVSKDGTPFSYYNVYRTEDDAKVAINVINKFFRESFPVLILEKWEVWVVDDVDTGKVKINTTHTRIKVYK